MARHITDNSVPPTTTTSTVPPVNPDDVQVTSEGFVLPNAVSYAGGYNPDWVAPTYKSFLDPTKPYMYLSDDVQLLNTMSKPQIIQIQSLLMSAFPEFKPVNVGNRYDIKTKQYFGYALARINNESEVRGKPIWQALPYLAQNPIPVTAPRTKKAPTYQVSNPADLRKAVEQSSLYVLGRTIDPAMTDRLVKAYQGIQVDEQRRNSFGGVQVQAPSADAFAEKKIKERFGAEADAYRFADFANTILGGG